MAIEHRIKPKYKSRNHQLVAELRASAGAGPPVDPRKALKKKVAEVAILMALIHGDEYRVQIDDGGDLVLVARRRPRRRR